MFGQGLIKVAMTLATFNGKCDNENTENKDCIDNEAKKWISSIFVAAFECNFFFKLLSL